MLRAATSNSDIDSGIDSDIGSNSGSDSEQAQPLSFLSNMEVETDAFADLDSNTDAFGDLAGVYIEVDRAIFRAGPRPSAVRLVAPASLVSLASTRVRRRALSIFLLNPQEDSS